MNLTYVLAGINNVGDSEPLGVTDDKKIADSLCEQLTANYQRLVQSGISLEAHTALDTPYGKFPTFYSGYEVIETLKISLNSTEDHNE
jgi:hypothetical protein